MSARIHVGSVLIGIAFALLGFCTVAALRSGPPVYGGGEVAFFILSAFLCAVFGSYFLAAGIVDTLQKKE